MDKAYSRSEPRVLYRAPIWLRPSDSGRSIVGETRNLSRRGMFVQVAPAPALGTEVLCELPGKPALRGRVAWIFKGKASEPSEATGVGIEFIDLSQDPPSLIEDLVGMRLADTQALEIRFAGLPSPIRATGAVTHEGIDLSTVLGFLKVGSDVSVASPEAKSERPLRGRVARVGMRTDEGVPRLQISIAVEPDKAPMALDTEDERWFPEIEFVGEPAPDLGKESMKLEAPTQAMVAELSFIDPEPTLRTFTEGMEEDDEPEIIDIKSMPTLAEAKTEPKSDKPEIKPEIKLEPKVEMKVESRPPLRALEGRARPFRHQKQTPPVRRSLVILLACVAIGSFAAAMFVPSAPPAPPVEEAQVEVTTVPTPAEPLPASAEAVKVEAEKPLAVVPAQANEHPVEEVAKAPSPSPSLSPSPSPSLSPSPSRTPSPTPSAPGPWAPHVGSVGGTPAIFVPMTGTKGLSTFTMSDPPGLAVDLPKGKTEVALKSYLLKDEKFRSLWVRSRPAGGLQIRLHTAPGVHLIAEAIDGGLRFRNK